ncbi:hypothetical protein GF339_20285 [candidate division KSB3 bacterium]|uniref:Putative zinc-finger domain-containing protein n=1 Tax=candidate division KSB3 bacterium TaxID=2044937 RepID=A0A9D5JZB6_9BACT|nr:hypothetical protein [candidate division KSB3 bacterium]MBD3326935.1 hypothetical protein [candidate division KSB3 bacterium]
MKCDAYHILISGYLDGELAEHETQMLKEHLQTCEACVAYLKRLETMKASVKRYALCQQVPEVPAHFARNITAQLQDLVQATPTPLSARLKTAYRSCVLHVIDRWVASLKARPFAWATAVSCALVALVGVGVVSVVEVSSPPPSVPTEPRSPQTMVSAPSPSESRQAEPPAPQLEMKPEMKMVARPQIRVAQEESPQVSVRSPDAGLKEQAVAPPPGQADTAADMIEIAAEQFSEELDHIEFADEPFIQVARNDSDSVKDYIYSHVIEMYQDQFLDDTVFVGYVQSAFD